MHAKMRAALICALVLASVSLLWMPSNVTADPSFSPTEYLVPDGTIRCDFTRSLSSGNFDNFVDGNPGTCSVTYWETNDTYLYWGNATSNADTSANWGIGRAIFTLSDIVDEDAGDYWEVAMTAWVAHISFIDPGWTQIGTYGVIDGGLWSAFNLGVGYSSTSSTPLDYEEMHTSALHYGYWYTDNTGSTDPPSQWNRPTTGTNWWEPGENDLYGRPWTTEEVNDMVIIIDIAFEKTVFNHLQSWDMGSGLAIALGGLQVAIAPETTYSPPDYTGAFILRPEADLDSSQFWVGGDYGNTVDLFDEVNETTMSSDQLTSYVNTSLWTGARYLMFDLEDVPTWAEDTTYVAYPWVIMAASDLTLVTESFVVYGISVPGDTASTSWTTAIQESWMNYSFASETNLESGARWTLTTLDRLSFLIVVNTVSATSIEKLNISQVAVLCIPYGTGDPDDFPTPIDPTEPVDFDALRDWFMGAGVPAMFGIIGFIGLMLTPVLGAYAYKGGMDWLQVLLLLFLFAILFFGLFWVGVKAHWEIIMPPWG